MPVTDKLVSLERKLSRVVKQFQIVPDLGEREVDMRRFRCYSIIIRWGIVVMPVRHRLAANQVG